MPRIVPHLVPQLVMPRFLYRICLAVRMSVGLVAAGCE